MAQQIFDIEDDILDEELFNLGDMIDVKMNEEKSKDKEPITDKSNIFNKLQQEIPFDVVKKRKGPGGTQLAYCDTRTIINRANDIFGPNGWSSKIIETKTEFIEKTNNGKFEITVSCNIRITANRPDLGFNNVSKEDSGVGVSIATKQSDAFETARKSAVSDAKKRAFRQFGDTLGLCFYNDDYIKRAKQYRPKPY